MMLLVILQIIEMLPVHEQILYLVTVIKPPANVCCPLDTRGGEPCSKPPPGRDILRILESW